MLLRKEKKRNKVEQNKDHKWPAKPKLFTIWPPTEKSFSIWFMRKKILKKNS